MTEKHTRDIKWPALVGEKHTRDIKWPVLVAEKHTRDIKWPTLVGEKHTRDIIWPALVAEKHTGYIKWPVLVTKKHTRDIKWPAPVAEKHTAIGGLRNHKRDPWVALSKSSFKYKSSIFRKIAFQSNLQGERAKRHTKRKKKTQCEWNLSANTISYSGIYNYGNNGKESIIKTP